MERVALFITYNQSIVDHTFLAEIVGQVYGVENVRIEEAD